LLLSRTYYSAIAMHTLKKIESFSGVGITPTAPIYPLWGHFFFPLVQILSQMDQLLLHCLLRLENKVG